MKRIIPTLILIALIASALMILPAAQASPPDDQCPSPYSSNGHHKWYQFSKEDATCTQAGKIHYVCSYCDRDYFDPIPALGHSMGEWKTVVSATCTEPGLEERACVRCGGEKTGYREQRETSPAHRWGAWEPDVPGTCVTKERLARKCTLCGAMDYWDKDYGDHVWGEGVVLNADKLLEEKIVEYTCTLCGATKTEAGDPLDVESIFHGLRVPIDVPDENPLVIVTQPAGGFIEHKDDPAELEALILSVEVAGGVPPYTYQWSRLPTTEVNNANREANVYMDIMGVVDSGEDSGIPSDRRPVYRRLADSNMPDYPADRMGTYYCVVTDDAGNEVKSDYAEVNFGLFIAYQPQNANLYKEGSVAMYCKAAGGVLNENGGYTYTLVGPTEQDRITDEEGWYCLDQPGEYYFIVEDAVGSVTSQKATVYSALPVWVECVSEPVLYTSGPEKVTVEMEFGGGVPPYTCDWLMTGSNEKLKTFVTYDTHDEMSFSDNGTYWLRVTDSMGDFTSANCRVINEQLKIARQPESGMLAVDGTGYDVSMEMAEGQAPFWYSLYRDDEIVAEHEDGAAISEGISCAGRYYYHVEDAVGRWADSDVFIVEDYQFYIHSYTGYTEIPEPYGGAELEITIFGGEAPYTCRWEWESFDDHIARSWTVIQQEETRVFTEWVEQPGFYWFIITDAYGNQAYTERIIVKYTGDAPFITTQPSDVYWPYVKGQEYYPTELYCKAINSARNDYYVKYQWWYYWENRWNAGSTESRFELPELTNSVLAYCTVTDLLTGESTVSRVATVQVGLSVSLHMSEGDQDGRHSRLHFFIEGGVGPYTYSVYTIRQNGCDEKGEPVFVETLYRCCTMFDFTGGAYYTDVENIWYGLTQYAEGKWDQVLHVAKYRVEVIDALGQTAEAGWIDASVLYDVFRYIDK